MDKIQNVMNTAVMTLGSKNGPVCTICGKRKKPIILDLPWGRRTVYGMCKCESEEYKKQREEDERKEKKRRLDKLFQQSRLGERFQQCTFENFIVRSGTEEAFTAAKDYTQNFNKYKKTGNGLLFSSTPGTGKTHLAAGIVNTLVKKYVSAIFVVVPELLMRLADARRNGTQTQLLNGLTDCDLLVLDDMGVEDSRDWNLAKIYTIMDIRYRAKRPIIVTTNLNSKELLKHIQPRTFSRLMEVSKTITLTCDDYRLRNVGRKGA